jgi:pimeloyl-ACP methyl ester carboxylesterase
MDDGYRLHVEVDGAGDAPTVVLVHGLAGSIAINWRGPGVIDRLVAAGLRVVAYDLRGHGRSDAPHDPAAYGDRRMVDDLRLVFDRFAGGATVAGYSLGAAITLLALEGALPARAAVVGAAAPAVLGWSDADEATRRAAIDALRGTGAPDLSMAGWVAFLDAIGADRLALAAVLAGHRPVVERWDRITVPVTVAAGRADTMAAPPREIAARLTAARAVELDGDHVSVGGSAELTALIVAAALEGDR